MSTPTSREDRLQEEVQVQALLNKSPLRVYCTYFSPFCCYTSTSDCYLFFRRPSSDAYLLYRTISGSQMCLEGMRILWMPSYFAGSHDNL